MLIILPGRLAGAKNYTLSNMILPRLLIVLPFVSIGAYGHCEEGCDKDSDCDGPLLCIQRVGSSALDPVPGVSHITW